MSQIYQGDEWKRCGESPQAPRTRTEEQAHINSLYARGKITRIEWSQRTDELSNMRKWSAEGRVQAA